MASLGFLPMHQSSIDVFVARWGEYADVLHHLLRRPVVSVENPQVPQQYLSAVINAMALFAFDRNTGEIRGIVDEYVGLRDPGRPIPAGAVRVHGIRDCDVTGRRLDDGRVLRLICQAEFFRGFAFGVFSTVYIHDFVTGGLVTLPGLEFEVEPEIVRDISFLGGWAPDSSQLVYSTFLNENGLGEIRIADLAGNIRQRFRREYYPFADWGPSQPAYPLARPPTMRLQRSTYPALDLPEGSWLASVESV